MIRWALKLAEFNIEWEHRPGTQNIVADVLSRNPIESIIGEKVNCTIIRSGGPGRKVQKGSEHRVPKRVLASNDGTNHNLPKFRKKSRGEETMTPTTSGYNLRPRNGKGVEFRQTIERKTQQGGPVRSRKGRGRNDSPYIEE
ncbi:uncharacterized protein TNCV_2481301 [Trichonephila clavipes]|nr:uncharacterized protein TNCV_2481301 [Trichonephila clavipes]